MKRLALGISCIAMLAGCGDPLRDVPRLAGVELAEPSEAATLAEVQNAKEDNRPIFARIFGSSDAPEGEEIAAPADLSDRADDAAITAPDGEKEAAVEVLAASDDGPSEALKAAAPQDATAEEDIQVNTAGAGGLLGLFARLGATDKASPEAPAAQDKKIAAAEAPEAMIEAALPEPETAEEVAAPVAAANATANPFKGLFSRKKSAVLTGPDAQEVAPGTVVAFGEIARVCDLKRSDLGKQVERSGGGKGKYRLYDSIPQSTAMRPFYITGFDDGCPRKITAALAIFASASQYETLKSSGALDDMSKSKAARAYGKARRQTCKSRVGKSCSDARKLEQETAFLTVYDRFGSSQNWRDILLHDGAVLAMD